MLEREVARCVQPLMMLTAAGHFCYFSLPKSARASGGLALHGQLFLKANRPAGVLKVSLKHTGSVGAGFPGPLP